MSSVDSARLELAYQTALSALLAERNSDDYWTGELSSSALSTATAVSALVLVDKNSRLQQHHDSLIGNGLKWLANCQNSDGGWGDTVQSLSNISTTMLCRAAFHLGGRARLPPSQSHSGSPGGSPSLIERTDSYLKEHFGNT